MSVFTDEEIEYLKSQLLVDDLASVNPWRVRGIEVRGEAEVLTSGG